MAMTDLDVQTDITRALKAFAQKQEQMANWNGFAIYCMQIAASFLAEFQNEFKGHKQAAGVDPARLAELNRQQASLTILEINNYANGTIKNQDFLDFVGRLKNDSLKEENKKMIEKISQKEAEINSLKSNQSSTERIYTSQMSAMKKQIENLQDSMDQMKMNLDTNTTEAKDVMHMFITKLTDEEKNLNLVYELLQTKVNLFSSANQNEIIAILQILKAKVESNDAGKIGWIVNEKNSALEEKKKIAEKLNQTQKELENIKKSKTSVSDESKQILEYFNELMSTVEKLDQAELERIISSLANIDVLKNDLGDELFIIFQTLKQKLVDLSTFTFCLNYCFQKNVVNSLKNIQFFDNQCSSAYLKSFLYQCLDVDDYDSCNRFCDENKGTAEYFCKFPCIKLSKILDDPFPQFELTEDEFEFKDRKMICTKLHKTQMELKITIFNMSCLLQHILNILITLSEDIENIKMDDGHIKYPGFAYQLYMIRENATMELYQTDFVKDIEDTVDEQIQQVLKFLFSYVQVEIAENIHAPLNLFHCGFYIPKAKTQLYLPPISYEDKTKSPATQKKITFASLMRHLDQYTSEILQIDPNRNIDDQLNSITFEF